MHDSLSNEVFMPIVLDINMKDLRDMEKREEQYRKEWEKGRIIKGCPECSEKVFDRNKKKWVILYHNHYSYAKGEIDPKECQSCRGEEGELIF